MVSLLVPSPKKGEYVMKVYLDDERKCPRGWTKVKTATDAIKLLQNNNVSEISLDHDLGIDENGYDVLIWIEKQVFLNNYKTPKIHIHTANPSARLKMENAKRSIYRKSKIFNK